MAITRNSAPAVMNHRVVDMNNLVGRHWPLSWRLNLDRTVSITGAVAAVNALLK